MAQAKDAAVKPDDQVPAEEQEHIWVRAITGLDARGPGQNETLLFEKDPAHPNGEAFIAGPLPVEVGKTTAVVALLHDKKIEEVPTAGVKEYQAKRAQAFDPLSAQQDLARRAADLDAREAALAQREADAAKDTGKTS